jgi:formylglycine-generating enzyme required for sulfatase activity
MLKVMANNWAIAVGINNYDFLPNAPLRFADRDALAMRQFLCDRAGFDAEKVLLCGNRAEGSKQATRAVMRNILLNDLKRAENADNLWFFFSGHGMTGTDKQDYLITVDGNPDDLQETAISIHFVTDRLRACKAKNIVLILDMCRDESQDSGRKSVESVAVSLRQLVKDREGQQGIITLFSCGRGESSYEIAELEQGAFTHALLEGLQQHAILKDLETYLGRRVIELHQSYPTATGRARKQVPLLITEPGWKYEEPILTNYATSADLSRLKDLALDAEHNGNIDRSIQLWKQVNLLATDPADCSQALNQLDRMLKLSSPRAMNPQPSVTKQPDVELVQLSLIEFTSAKIDPIGNIIDRPIGNAEIFVEDLGNNVSIIMVKVPEGKVLMESLYLEETEKTKKSQHQIRVEAFYLGQTLVTQSQWRAVTLLPKVELELNPNPSYFKGDNRPVEKIDWYEANEFCQRLSRKYTSHKYRLPSEVEWEYSCRANTTTQFYFGETLILELANYLDKKKYATNKQGRYIGETTKVMSFPPNLFGLYDMHGNVREWCLDSGIELIKKSNHSFRFLRGGCSISRPEDCRSSSRHRDVPRSKNYNNGFRIACSLQ